MLIAHRGARGYAPENTLAAIKKALDLGASWIEIDVHFLGGHLLVVHGPKVRDAQGKAYALHAHAPAVLRSIDLGGGQHIPTLDEVLNYLEGRASLNIELKGINTAEPVALLLKSRIEKGGWKANNLLVSSFRFEELSTFRGVGLEVPLAVLAEHFSQTTLRFAQSIEAKYINLSRRTIRPEIVRKARELGFGVLVFTVNSVAEAEELKSIGVSGIFTDYIDRF